MPRGGSRARSGPAKDPNSGRSDRARATAKKAAAAKKSVATKKTASAASDQSSAVTNNEFSPTALPANGRRGNPPPYPLPKMTRHVLVPGAEGKPTKVASDAAGTAFRKRELEIWRAEWKTPQAVAWERESWRWPRVALYCRLTAVVEAEPDSNASLVSRQRELAIEIGLTPDGLKMNGWAIAPDQLAAQRAKKAAAPKKTTTTPVRRLRG